MRLLKGLAQEFYRGIKKPAFEKCAPGFGSDCSQVGFSNGWTTTGDHSTFEQKKTMCCLECGKPGSQIFQWLLLVDDELLRGLDDHSQSVHRKGMRKMPRRSRLDVQSMVASGPKN